MAEETIAKNGVDAGNPLATLIDAVDLGAATPLLGGVSSDIRVIEAGGKHFCIKQALPRLKVKADWRAPVERNHSEAEWLRVAGTICPDAVPKVLYEDRAAGRFAMEYLPPDQFPVWKAQLRDGIVDRAVAATVGERLARIHAATAGSEDIAERFATDHIFFPIRAEPYLIATGRAHPELRSRLDKLADRLMQTTLALVHGDVSPKNILVGPRGPVFLDAECAWYGDPSFDLAFVLNHLLLKCAWRPQWTARYLECFETLSSEYLARVGWENRDDCESRTAQLLPGLLLGRIDGKSPAEYITDDTDKDMIRSVATRLLLEPVATLSAVGSTWRAACDARMHRSEEAR